MVFYPRNLPSLWVKQDKYNKRYRGAAHEDEEEAPRNRLYRLWRELHQDDDKNVLHDVGRCNADRPHSGWHDLSGIRCHESVCRSSIAQPSEEHRCDDALTEGLIDAAAFFIYGPRYARYHGSQSYESPANEHGRATTEQIEAECRVYGGKRANASPDACQYERHLLAESDIGIQNDLVVLDDDDAGKPEHLSA